MLLRTRITLLVAAGFLVLLGCFGALFYMRDRMDAERLSAVVIQGQQALWRESVEVEASALDKSLDAFSASPELLRAALMAGDRSAVVAGLNKLDVFSSGTPLIFEVLSEDREALLVQGTPQDRGLLDDGSMDRVLTASASPACARSPPTRSSSSPPGASPFRTATTSSSSSAVMPAAP